MLKQLPPPQLWDDFERLCRDLWAALLADPQTLMHGRTGQAQCGVDVYGYDLASGTSELVGVQCKGKDGLLGSHVSEAELRAEVAKAQNFRPRLKQFCLATTAPRDATVQRLTRELHEENVQAGSFAVTTRDWPSISEAIQSHPSVLRKYYPEAFVYPNLQRSDRSILLRLPLLADHEERIAALFEVSDIRAAADQELRCDIRDLVLEVASNAYRHGSARRLEVEISSRNVTIRDDGTAFNVIEALEQLPISPPHQGLKYVRHFLDKYADVVQMAASFHKATDLNEVRLTFTKPIARIRPDECVITFAEHAFVGRAGAAVVADRVALPEECAVYTLRVDRTHFMMSSLYVYLARIVSKLPAGKRLRVVVPTKAYKTQIDMWFDASVVEVVC